MMSWEACRHLLHLRKKPRNDDKLPSSLSFSTHEKKYKEMTMSLLAHCLLLHLKKKKKRWQRAKRLVVIFYTWRENQEMLVTFLVLSLDFLVTEESQINVDYCGYTMRCLQ
jgi:hypothetical protein